MANECQNEWHEARLVKPARRTADGQGFAAFGRVTNGMNVVKQIQAGATNQREQLLAPITIARVYRK